MGVTLPTRTLGVLLGVETTVPRPLANQLEGPGDKSVAKYGGGGGIRTHDTLAGITVFKFVAVRPPTFSYYHQRPSPR